MRNPSHGMKNRKSNSKSSRGMGRIILLSTK
jgi:hypothetical protein